MTTRKFQLCIALLGTVLLCALTLAQEPKITINKDKHPNLAGAQQHIIEANRLIAEAQKDNRFDMKGHAARARQLLLQADNELTAAAETANAANAANEKKGKDKH